MTELVQDKRPDLINVIETEAPKELGLIPAWSYSALKTYETCAYRSYISKVKRIQEDFGPAAARGTDIHQQAEDYVRGDLKELPDTLKKFQSQFEDMREGFINATVELEGEWGFTIDWEALWLDGKRCMGKSKTRCLCRRNRNISTSNRL